MGVATASIRLRESQANTVANVIETANAFWQLIEDAGMVRVSNPDYAGQAGRLVSGVPGTDETQFSALGTTNGESVVFFNVYKHPTLNFYLKVFVADTGFSTTTSRALNIRYGLFFDLDGSGSHDPAGYTSFSPSTWYTSSVSFGTGAAALPNVYKNTYISVGDDHLCLSSEPHNNPMQNVSYQTSFFYAPGKSLLSLSVFADTDGAGDMVVVSPAFSANLSASSASTSTYWGFASNDTASNYNNAYQFTAIRYYTYEAGSKVALFRGGAAAGFILDAATPSTTVGTRVQQAQLYINGVLRKFNFGFIPEAVATDQSVIELDLTGAGSRKYRVAKGYGPANTGITGMGAASNYDTTSNSCIILPWNAP